MTLADLIRNYERLRMRSINCPLRARVLDSLCQALHSSGAMRDFAHKGVSYSSRDGRVLERPPLIEARYIECPDEEKGGDS